MSEYLVALIFLLVILTSRPWSLGELFTPLSLVLATVTIFLHSTIKPVFNESWWKIVTVVTILTTCLMLLSPFIPVNEKIQNLTITVVYFIFVTLLFSNRWLTVLVFNMLIIFIFLVAASNVTTFIFYITGVFQEPIIELEGWSPTYEYVPFSIYFPFSNVIGKYHLSGSFFGGFGALRLTSYLREPGLTTIVLSFIVYWLLTTYPVRKKLTFFLALSGLLCVSTAYAPSIAIVLFLALLVKYGGLKNIPPNMFLVMIIILIIAVIAVVYTPGVGLIDKSIAHQTSVDQRWEHLLSVSLSFSGDNLTSSLTFLLSFIKYFLLFIISKNKKTSMGLVLLYVSGLHNNLYNSLTEILFIGLLFSPLQQNKV